MITILLNKPFGNDREERLYKKIYENCPQPVETCGLRCYTIEYIRSRNPNYVICFGKLLDKSFYEFHQIGSTYLLQLPELSYMLNHASSIGKAIKIITQLGEQNAKKRDSS